MPSKTNIVMPLRCPFSAKQRLRSVLSIDERAGLVMALFEKNLACLKEHFPQYHILVVTDSSVVYTAATKNGATVLKEDAANGLTSAVELATRWSLDHGFGSQLVLPADLAHLDCEELAYLLRQSRSVSSILVCPAKDNGTNALLTTPPNAIEFWYGENSATKYVERAMQEGVHCQLVKLHHMKFDVDTPEDLMALMDLKEIGSFSTVSSISTHDTGSS